MDISKPIRSHNIGQTSIIPFPTHPSRLSTNRKAYKITPSNPVVSKVRPTKRVPYKNSIKVIDKPTQKILSFKSTGSTIYRLDALHDTAARKIDRLTSRQREIMNLVLSGQLSKNIATDLGISIRTVENHRAAIKKRTNARSRLDLARLALAAAQSNSNKIERELSEPTLRAVKLRLVISNKDNTYRIYP